MADPREAVSAALYELGIVADVMRSVAAADISGNRPICGTSVQWFSEHVEVQRDRIEVALNQIGRARA